MTYDVDLNEGGPELGALLPGTRTTGGGAGAVRTAGSEGAGWRWGGMGTRKAGKWRMKVHSHKHWSARVQKGRTTMMMISCIWKNINFEAQI